MYGSFAVFNLLTLSRNKPTRRDVASRLTSSTNAPLLVRPAHLPEAARSLLVMIVVPVAVVLRHQAYRRGIITNIREV